VHNECHYQVNVNETPNYSNNTNISSGGGVDSNPEPPNENSIVAKNPDSDKTEKDKFRCIPQSTSANSISSAVSYTSTDLALAAELDKQNFRNVVNSDTAKATELYHQKVDELVKAKSIEAK
jgi:hypothetical protein